MIFNTLSYYLGSRAYLAADSACSISGGFAEVVQPEVGILQHSHALDVHTDTKAGSASWMHQEGSHSLCKT